MKKYRSALKARAATLKVNLVYDATRPKSMMILFAQGAKSYYMIETYSSHAIALAHLIAGGIQMMNTRQ